MGKYVLQSENPEDALCAIMIPNTYNWLQQIIVSNATGFLLHCNEILMELQKQGQNIDLFYVSYYDIIWKSHQMPWK